MKSKIFLIFFSIFFFKSLFAENISIVAENISFERNENITIFENDVVVKTRNKTIKSEYVKYFRSKGFLIIKENIVALDERNNSIEANYAEYFEEDEILVTKGKTKVFTAEKYLLDGEDITVDNKNKIIKSDKSSLLIDKDENQIFLENFEYLSEENLFKSIGFIKILDQNKNIYEFSQIYIDTKKKEILGTDTKSFLNQNGFKIDDRNKPRIFANTVSIAEGKSSFKKSVFTLCDYRINDKCPPWSIQSKQMLHDNVKKTIYYENAVVKVYDIPIFYFPRLSHPDHTVDRRSGFLPPTLYDSKNLGSGISIPYFMNLGSDKNFTFTNRLYVSENPLFLGEYHQAFKNSNLLTDFGYTQGYKKTSTSKKSGEKSHFFTKYVKNFTDKNNFENSLNINFQEVSNDKYLKLYKIESNLVDHNLETLENSINYTHEREDLFLGFDASIYETLKDDYEDKYEYILPEITLDKNILSNEKFGNLDLQTNIKVHNYETNKFTSFFVNDFEWSSNDIVLNSKIKNKFLAKFKNINYEAKNIDIYKDDPTNELHGAIGLFSEIDFQKRKNNFTHLLTPKLLLKLSPGNMRKEDGGGRLSPINAFNLDRLNKIDNFETGNTATLGFDLNIKEEDTEKFNFSVAQIINEMENKKIGSKTSLDEKLSDIVGTTSYNINERIKLTYNFSMDQNYQELN